MTQALLRAGVRLRVAGDTSALPPPLAAALAAAAAATAGGAALELTVAVNYSGRQATPLFVSQQIHYSACTDARNIASLHQG